MFSLILHKIDFYLNFALLIFLQLLFRILSFYQKKDFHLFMKTIKSEVIKKITI